MSTRHSWLLLALALSMLFLLGCDLSGLITLISGGSPGTDSAIPTTSNPSIVPPSQPSGNLKCDPQTLGFPLLPDAANCQHFDIITTFQTNLPPKDAIIIYNELLVKEGWKRKDDGTLSGIGSWVKGNQQLNILTTVEKGTTTVQIQALGAAASAPTNIVRGATPAPTMGRGVTPLPTARIYVPPNEITVLPEPAQPQGDFMWTGMDGKGRIINFCVYRSEIYRVHYITQFFCRDKQTGQRYSHWINVGPSDLPSFLIFSYGRFNVSGEYTIPDGVYKDVTFGMCGYLHSSRGRLWVSAFSENQVVRCDEEGMPAFGIDVMRTNAVCSP
ncbi:MAG: hypothetical protein FJ009_18015 [Chloroflexi bacterium]|nr:hypothetical protein [Chloroflexota bacterium]